MPGVIICSYLNWWKVWWIGYKAAAGNFQVDRTGRVKRGAFTTYVTFQ